MKIVYDIECCMQQMSNNVHFCLISVFYVDGWPSLLFSFFLLIFFYKALFKMAENFTIVLYIVLILLIALSWAINTWDF